MTDGNEAQIRLIAESLADAAVVKLATSNPELLRGKPTSVELPPPLKWAAGIAAGLLTLAASSGLLWLVSTVNTMQVTLARMDERQQGTSATADSKYTELERRVTTLEGSRNTGGTR